MTNPLTTLAAVVLAALGPAIATTALADPGHVAESGGHTHWLALAALAAAVMIAGWQVLRIASRRLQHRQAQRSSDG